VATTLKESPFPIEQAVSRAAEAVEAYIVAQDAAIEAVNEGCFEDSDVRADLCQAVMNSATMVRGDINETQHEALREGVDSLRRLANLATETARQDAA
jgi:hypothetical protein